MKKIRGISLIILVITIIVILILAGAVILSLSKNNPISQSMEASYKTSLNSYIDKLGLYLLTKIDNSGDNRTSVNASNTTSPSVQQITGMSDAEAVNYVIRAGQLEYTGTDANNIIWFQDLCGVKANAPALATGMTPIKWNGSTWINTTASDPEWYSYDNISKKWANAKTADGSMWVWIPRYIYNINSLHETSSTGGGEIKVQFSKGTNDNWNTGITLNTVDTYLASNMQWTNHTAFTLGSCELSGIWIAKFEASNSSGKVKIIPNSAGWRSINVSDIYTTCKAIETYTTTYGWGGIDGSNVSGIDTHMIKNNEWGAVVYLAQSVYGINAQVWNNPSWTTGIVGTGPDANSGTTFIYTDTANNGPKSGTTGNVYGVFDMAGGVWEYVAAYYSGGTNLSTYGSALVSAGNEYKDIYTVTTDTKSEALQETKGWFSDYQGYPTLSAPFFMHGGRAEYIPGSGTFAFTGYSGDANGAIGFRPTLAVGTGI